jgi:hypothetical protein
MYDRRRRGWRSLLATAPAQRLSPCLLEAKERLFPCPLSLHLCLCSTFFASLSLTLDSIRSAVQLETTPLLSPSTLSLRTRLRNSAQHVDWPYLSPSHATHPFSPTATLAQPSSLPRLAPNSIHFSSSQHGRRAGDTLGAPTTSTPAAAAAARQALCPLRHGSSRRCCHGSPSVHGILGRPRRDFALPRLAFLLGWILPLLLGARLAHHSAILLRSHPFLLLRRLHPLRSSPSSQISAGAR